MDLLKPKTAVSGFWRTLVALVCITLAVACGTIQAVHVHAHDDVTHSDCSLCVTAHIAVEVSSPVVIPVVLHPVSSVETVVPPARPVTLSSFGLFTRPPPADDSLT